MHRDLLIEIGVEELPASFVARALEALPGLATKLLADARLTHGAMRALGTPRRLALAVTAVADRQPDLSEDLLGPPKSVGIGPDGKPTKAGEGFARKAGFGPDAIRVVSTDKGEYLAVRREEKGKPAADVLPELVARLCAQIPFQKSMRWGPGEITFGRPVHWLVVLHGERVIDASFAGVTAGRKTRGHRFLSPRERELDSASSYVDVLRDAKVLVDPSERREAMQAALERGARELSGKLVDDAFLVEECLGLVEHPFVVAGAFDPSYLDLPEDVIVAVMRGHQRYFAVRDATTGALLPAYLNVVNTANDPDTIRRGNDRVLRARLADARFFVDEDRKTTLASRADKLGGVVFQAKLGSVREKTERVQALLSTIRQFAPEVPSHDGVAALAKADLVTLIVGEFPELQGVMGRWYALEEGLAPEVADAIRDHYCPKGASDAVPVQLLAAALSVADRADTLAGCFGLGLVPSGSADPFALRRAALGIVRVALEGPLDVRLDVLFDRAHTLYTESGKTLAPKADVLAKLDDFLRGRLRAFFEGKHPGDVVDACLGAWRGGSVRDLAARLRALEAFRQLPEFASLAVAFKRTHNITKDAPPGDVDAALLEPGEESTLAEAWNGVRPRFAAHVKAEAYEQALMLVANELREPIDRYFEKVFVMVDDARVRDNRLRLLGDIARALTSVAHFHLLSG